MKSTKWIYYLVAGLLVLIYYAGEATGLLFLAMLIILPVGFWVIWNINPDKPSE
jgi:hypothetical protein